MAQGLDYVELGRQTGKMAAQVLKGEKKASEFPFEIIEEAAFSRKYSGSKKSGIEIPEEMTDSAAEVFEEIAEAK